MKLELKHLVGYLPYELKFIWSDTKEIYGITFDSDTDYTSRLYPLSTLIFTIENQYLKDSYDLGWKPILRPLTDLTKICTDIGDMCTLELIFGEQYRDSLNVGQSTGQIYPWQRSPILWKWHKTEQLFKYHFDVFGLIEQGLAIDINTINQKD